MNRRSEDSWMDWAATTLRTHEPTSPGDSRSSTSDYQEYQNLLTIRKGPVILRLEYLTRRRQAFRWRTTSLRQITKAFQRA
jgi:hypothetical protein